MQHRHIFHLGDGEQHPMSVDGGDDESLVTAEEIADIINSWKAEDEEDDSDEDDE